MLTIDEHTCAINISHVFLIIAICLYLQFFMAYHNQIGRIANHDKITFTLEQ